LALATDAWSRTGRVEVEAAAPGPVTMRSGLELRARPAAADEPRLALASELPPVRQLDRTLCEIEERYGAALRERVMLEMEYGGTTARCAGDKLASRVF